MKYEYLKVPAQQLMIKNEIKVEKLNALGEKGWKLVTITNWDGKPAFMYFVRELAAKPMVKLTIVPVEVFGADEGYGLCDAVSWFGDCNRAFGKIYRVEDIDYHGKKLREDGDTVEVWVKKSDVSFFDKKFGS